MRKFLLKLCYTVLPLWLAVVALVTVYYLVVIPEMKGDLGRLGKIPTGLYYQRDDDPAITQHTLYPTIQHADSIRLLGRCDILTCGDSFSQPDENGYQGYMVMNGLSFINYSPNGDLMSNPFQTAYGLMRQGYIDSTNVKMLLIESVERSLPLRLRQLNLSDTLIHEEEPTPKQVDKSWSLAEAKIFLEFQLGMREEENPVKQLQLDQPLFSGRYGNRLYIYADDVIPQLQSIPSEEHDSIRQKTEALFAEAAAKGIRLLILICPDKYDMYQQHIVANPYPKKTVNEDFRRIVGPRRDVVMGKEIIAPFIRRGEKDIYFWDDTHWNFKAIRTIADTLTSRYQEFVTQ